MINITDCIMADKKNTSNNKEDEKPTKEEYAVAKFLRFNVPTKPAKLHNMAVHCFFASAAVDALMESKWSASKNAQEPLFVDRNSCVTYCQRLMEKGLFHRAERVQRNKDKVKSDRYKKKKVKDTAEKEDGATGDELRERKVKKEQEEEEDPEKSVTCETEEVKEEEKNEEKQEKKDKKKEKPIKLVMTEDHTFLDGEENIYVWIYDPASAKTIFIGSLIVFGVAAMCLFPLWPPWVHFGVYYASLTGAVFVGFILSLVVLRFILFCVIWLLTLGRHHFWLLPNLTEEVGFLESFQPLYTHAVVLKTEGKAKSKSGKKSKGKGRKKNKSSDKEDTESDPEFEMIGRGDLEEDELGERMEGEEDSEENKEAREEEEEYGVEEEEEDYEEEEEGQNDRLEDEYEEQGEEEEEEEESSELKKDK